MSQVQVDNKVAALLAAGNKDLSNATPNAGEGFQGEWPPEGKHDLYVISSKESIGKFKDSGSTDPIDCVEIVFEYEWARNKNDPTFDASKPPLIFSGARFQLVPDFESKIKADGSKINARMNWDRFINHVAKILNIPADQCTDALARYTEVKAKIAGSTRVAVHALIEYREWTAKKNKDGTPIQPGQLAKKGINKTEYISENIAS